MKPVQLGIIGCGTIGKVHLTAATHCPRIAVTAVADLNEDLARETARQFKVEAVYGQGEDLLDDPDVEAVVLALPTLNRTNLALRAFARGKHVLVEKPVAMNAAEVEEMIGARGNLVGACCSSRYRFLDSAAAAAAFVQTGVLGPIRAIHCRAVQAANPRPANTPPPWRLSKAINGGGILVNWGCYDLDYLLGIMNWSLAPRQVFAHAWPLAPELKGNAAPGSDAESHLTALIRCADGTVIGLERGEYMAQKTEKAWRIVGTRGSLELNMDLDAANRVIHHHADPVKGLISETIWEGNEEKYETIHHGPVQDFAGAIGENRPPKTTLEQALVIQKITDAIYASAEFQTLVEVR